MKKEHDIDSWTVETDFVHLHRQLSEVIKNHLDADRENDVLEAGCGRKWALKLKPYAVNITGIDQDEVALTKRQQTHNDLQHAIVGDLAGIELDESAYDLIYCSFVLEHVIGAETVLDGFARWIRPGGLICIKVPDPGTVFGFVTKKTPMFVHVLYKKWIMGEKNAGKPGFDPYPVAYEPIIRPEAFLDWAEAHGLEPVFAAKTNFIVNRSPFIRIAYKLFAGFVRLLSLGRLESAHAGYAIVLKARIGAAASNETDDHTPPTSDRQDLIA